jgi:ParB/RepB/Spo0J family partition protein
MSSTAIATQCVSIDLIDVGENVREIDQEHVEALAASISLRGLIVPLPVRPADGRFKLVAGEHRYLACRLAGLTEVGITPRERDGSSADSAAENILRKQLTPLEEARAVQHMLDEGFTLDGAATALGWNHKLVTARAKILELPEIALRLLGTGELPVSTVTTLARISDVSRELCELALTPIAEGTMSGSQLARDPGWVIGSALRKGRSKVFAEYLGTLQAHAVGELRLGKKTDAALVEAEALHRKLDAHAYGPPSIRFAESDIDQARAAGVLIEFEHGTPIITDRPLYRELAKQAINRTVQELRAAKDASDTDRSKRRAQGKDARSPQQQLDAEHRAAVRQFAARAHGTNLDLGAALIQNLAVVNPEDMDVARFFAYGLLGGDDLDFRGDRPHTIATIAANGIRLVIDEHRTTTTPRLKSGGLGKTKVAYGETEDAAAWLWKFIEGAKSAGELYGRTLVVFASQHYANQLVLAASKRRHSALPASHKSTARKAFERITKSVLPTSHAQLQRAIEREASEHTKRERELAAAATQHLADLTETDTDSTDSDLQDAIED